MEEIYAVAEKYFMCWIYRYAFFPHETDEKRDHVSTSRFVNRFCFTVTTPIDLDMMSSQFILSD